MASGKIVLFHQTVKKHRLMDNIDKLNILLVGSGGREHAIAWKLAQSERIQHIFVAPGITYYCK